MEFNIVQFHFSKSGQTALRTQAIGNRFGRIDRSVQILCYFLKILQKSLRFVFYDRGRYFFVFGAIFGGKVQGF